MNQLAREIMAIRIEHGFETSKENMLGKLMLVVTEISEAAEDVRHQNWDHFSEEIADTIIRLLDICATLDIDIEAEIARKVEINRARPFRHGKESSA